MLLYHACPCTMQVYLHLHLLHCHLHITMCHHLWTLLCEHASAKCFLKHIWPFMSIYNLCLCTYTCTTLPLANHHVWTMCEHYSVNIHLSIVSLKEFYLHVHAQSKFIYIYIYYTATCIFTNVWTGVNHVLPLGCVLQNMCQLLL